jgi:hypothetical protein
MRGVPIETILHVFLSLFAGAAALAALGAGVLFGAKPLLKAMLPQMDLQRELLQGNRAAAFFSGVLLSCILIAAAMVLVAVYNQVLR